MRCFTRYNQVDWVSEKRLVEDRTRVRVEPVQRHVDETQVRYLAGNLQVLGRICILEHSICEEIFALVRAEFR
jgi:hypothetical protein